MAAGKGALPRKLRSFVDTRYFEPRGIRVYGVGAAKTGTHSLGTMFADRVRSAHELGAQHLIRLILDAGDDRRKIRRHLRVRDALLRLKVDASQVNIYLVDDLLALYPDSRFVLTIRPPMSWLRSIIDDSLRREISPTWMRFRHFRFDWPGPFPAEEVALEERGIFQIAGYLSYWRDAIERAVNRVPAEQLLVVKVEELEARSAEIAAFCGIPGGAVDPERAHAFVNPRRFHVLSEVPAEHLLSVAEAECGDLMRQYFPERDLAADVDAIRQGPRAPGPADAVTA